METIVELPRTEKKLMTYEEYLAWADEGVHAEWVNGEVIVFPPRTNAHQTIVGFLDLVISLFADIFDLGRLHLAPFELRIDLDGPSRLPDLVFLAKAHLDQLTNERIVGPPDLIIEVVSADSVHRDRAAPSAYTIRRWLMKPRTEHCRGILFPRRASRARRSAANSRCR